MICTFSPLSTLTSNFWMVVVRGSVSGHVMSLNVLRWASDLLLMRKYPRSPLLCFLKSAAEHSEQLFELLCRHSQVLESQEIIIFRLRFFFQCIMLRTRLYPLPSDQDQALEFSSPSDLWILSEITPCSISREASRWVRVRINRWHPSVFHGLMSHLSTAFRLDWRESSQIHFYTYILLSMYLLIVRTSLLWNSSNINFLLPRH